jgi:serine/threonine-protein kinase
MDPPETTVRIVGRYALYGVLASGGMATVHFGRLLGPVGFSRTVAIKRLHPQLAADPEFVAMFLDEARLAARIRHPNVVPTLDVVALRGELFLVMEYVAGESMSRLVRAARERGDVIPPSITVAILVGVLHGLHAAHEAKNERGAPLGIVHRDVSPQNILVGVDGQARVLDFGVAKAAGRVQTTREGQLKGKLAYMAPEQLRGETCSRQTDIYAASVVLWEALTGGRLFKAENEGAVIKKVLDDVVLPPSRAAVAFDGPTRQVVGRLDAIVLRGLARDPATRFATAREMALDLESTLAPATASQVSDWIEAMASDVLLGRAARVAEIESLSTEVAATAAADSTPLAGAPDDMHSAASASSLSVASNRGRVENQAPGRRRGMILAGGLGAMLLASVAVLLISRAGLPVTHEGPEVPSGASAATGVVPSSTAAATTETTRSTDAPPVTPAEGARDGAPPSSSGSVAGIVHASAGSPVASASRPPPKSTNKAAPGRANTCNPPFTYDASGMKHYKPECF